MVKNRFIIDEYLLWYIMRKKVIIISRSKIFANIYKNGKSRQQNSLKLLKKSVKYNILFR